MFSRKLSKPAKISLDSRKIRVKKKQQRVQMILDSKQIDYEAIDITEPGKEKDKEFMQQNGKVRETLGKYPLPPQIFNDEDFCGDYEDFDLANEVDELEKFLHIETSAKDSETDSKPNEESESFTKSEHHLSTDSVYNPYEYHTFKIKYDPVNGLREQIISTNDLAGENVETEVKKSEVNGECEAVLEPSSENLTENIETSAEEVVAPEKEESSTQENKENDEVEKDKEENVEEEEQEVVEGEAAEKGEEEKEEVETPKEEKVENEETSPPLEEKETDDAKEEEEAEKEEEEKESDNESEKSQED